MGRDTTGAYVGNLVSGTGVTLTGLGNEGATPTISIGQDVSTTSDVTFNKVNADSKVYISDATQSTGANSGALVVLGGGSFGGNVYISGNLHVAGNTTTFSSNTVIIDDPLIYLGEDNPSDVVDLGIVSSFTNPGYQHTGFVRDASDGIWKLFANVAEEPTSIIDFTNATYSTIKVGNVLSDTALFTGNVTVDDISATTSRLGTVTSGTWNGTSIDTAYTDAKIKSIANSGPVTAVTSSGDTTIGFNNSGVTANTYGGASKIPVFTVNQYGLVTSAANVAVAGVSNFAASGNTFTTSTADGGTFSASI